MKIKVKTPKIKSKMPESKGGAKILFVLLGTFALIGAGYAGIAYMESYMAKKKEY